MSEQREDPQPRRLIYTMRERVQETRNRYYQHARYGSVPQDIHLDLAEVVVEYHDVLVEHSDEQPVKDTFPDVSDIRRTFGETAVVLEEAPGDTRNKRRVEKPGPLSISTDRLLAALRELDTAAKQLGFGATVESDIDVFGVEERDE